ncbi:hypothetical protein GS398_03125 [Pedobacter sp. HMF7056]|uniref:DUF4153 domain-containing protein n=2 Tax=Hufsiella ginkgonis TaxID=2695274 RepID=A0A7K1XU06_9SPHI|nr:hypothetical protein [Hufsiella ginkgonis]
MKEEIRAGIDDATRLEKMYRSNSAGFKQAFNEIYPELTDRQVAAYWYERLNYEGDGINWGTGRELVMIIAASLFAGLVAKLPAFLHLEEDFFYPRNVGFVVFPVLSAYFAWKNKLPAGKVTAIAAVTLIAVLFINSLPDVKTSDTLILSCMHLLLLLWSVLGFAFVGEAGNNEEKRLAYLKYNGDLVVITALILLAGGIMTGVTIGLFELIGFHIEKFYFENVGVFGLAAAPIVGTYLTRANPQLVGKVSPVIAKIFSPLVLVMLVVYLIAIVYANKDPYNDRQFLIVFNALLIGVMAIIFFSVAESTKATKSRMEAWVLLLLAFVTIVVNGVALSAILFRISEGGITPNRAAVLGGNVLILVNLVLVTVKLFAVTSGKAGINVVGKIITFYLPVYVVWTVIVTFVFPFIFGFK